MKILFLIQFLAMSERRVWCWRNGFAATGVGWRSVGKVNCGRKGAGLAWFAHAHSPIEMRNKRQVDKIVEWKEMKSMNTKKYNKNKNENKEKKWEK